jgi:uncharacterized membrane protein
METIKTIFAQIAEIIDIIAISILLFGFVKILLKYIVIEFKNFQKTQIRLLQRIRCDMGIYILLALDFLIASDIIHTISELSHSQLIELSVMIVLRIAIGYFLGKEINEIESRTN